MKRREYEAYYCIHVKFDIEYTKNHHFLCNVKKKKMSFVEIKRRRYPELILYPNMYRDSFENADMSSGYSR